mgnify:CR=1 FL=1
MKSSNIFALLAFTAVTIIVGHATYTSRKRRQQKEELQFAVTHPVSAMDIFAHSSMQTKEDKEFGKVLGSGLSYGKHLPAWAKRQLKKLIVTQHSN